MEPDGVWVVYHNDWYWYLNSVHETELEAHRANKYGYEVGFLPFGVEFSSWASGLHVRS